MTDLAPAAGTGAPSRNGSRRPRVAVVHHGFVPNYRVRFYERLAREGDAEYVIFHGEVPTGTGEVSASGPFNFPNVKIRNHEIRLGRKRVIYQALVRELLTGDYDAVVLGAWLRFVSTLVAHPLLKARRRPVILWGQGGDKQEDVSGALAQLLKVAARAKASIARTADGYLVYTARGARRLAEVGMDPERIFVVHNTIDMDEQGELYDELRDADEGRLRTELGLREDSAVLLYVGRVYREKRVPELLHAVRLIRGRQLSSTPVEVVVIGDGPHMDEVNALADTMDGVHRLGAISDQSLVAKYMRTATAAVIPGAVGLGVNHAFSQGVPLVTRESDLHGPEVEYLRHEHNGLMVDGDGEAFAAALADLVNDAAHRGRLAEGALETRDELSVENMVRSFNDGVVRTLGARR